MMPTSSFRIISGATESTYDADSGDFAYYCVVTDNAGNSVSSERAETGWKLRIGKQPENRNLFGENSVTLSCAAADGSPFGEEYNLPYAYYWFDADGNQLPYRDDGTAEITEEGEYYCVAEDSANNTVTSGTAIVYSAEPMTLADLNDRVLKEGETDEIKASVTGGVPPYTYMWSKWGPTGGTAVGDDTDTLSVSCKDSGSYILDVLDSMGAYDWQTFSVSQYKEPLTIARTDFSSEITNQKDASIKVEIVAGTAPYTYTLLNDGTEQESKTSYGTSASFTLSEPSWYAVRIQDSEDRSAETEYMQAGDARLRILEHPKGVTKKYNPSSLESVHLVCKAAGHPDHLLKYQWQGKTGSGWTTLNSSWLNYLDMEESISNHTFYSLHGAYRCVVTDTATGESIISDEAPILFSMEATAAQEGESTTLTVKVDGGTYPYTIKAYQTAYRYGYWDPRYPNSKYFEKITYEFFFSGRSGAKNRQAFRYIYHA